MKSDARPWVVTLLSLGVLTLAIVFVTRFLVGLRLPDLPLTVPRWYFSFTGALWGTAGLSAAYGLYTGRRWAPALARWGGIAFDLWYWADRLLLVRSDYAARSWPLAAALLLVGTLLFWLGLGRPEARTYFGENAV